MWPNFFFFGQKYGNPNFAEWLYATRILAAILRWITQEYHLFTFHNTHKNSRPVPIDFFSYRPIPIQLRFLSADADADSRYKENKRKIWTCIYPPNFHQYPRQFFPRQLSQNLCFWRFILEVKWVVKSNTKTRIHNAFPSINLETEGLNHVNNLCSMRVFW